MIKAYIALLYIHYFTSQSDAVNVQMPTAVGCLKNFKRVIKNAVSNTIFMMKERN
jgi:hypothetical protein